MSSRSYTVQASAGGQLSVGDVRLPTYQVFVLVFSLLVCLAVWVAMAGRSVADKVLAIVFPISAFVAAGFEHSIANMYFMPLAMLLGVTAALVPTATVARGYGSAWRSARLRRAGCEVVMGGSSWPMALLAGGGGDGPADRDRVRRGQESGEGEERLSKLSRARPTSRSQSS